ncbi:MAG TPA: hypothetical protein PK971_12625, partial [Saprospiraceae bacterium]|nr:hypothetical protein [Saprospiraceae bacterium]
MRAAFRGAAAARPDAGDAAIQRSGIVGICPKSGDAGAAGKGKMLSWETKDTGLDTAGDAGAAEGEP